MVGRRFRDTLCHYTDKHSGRATSASPHLLRAIEMTSPAKVQHLANTQSSSRMQPRILLLAYCWLPASTVSFVLPRHATLEVP